MSNQSFLLEGRGLDGVAAGDTLELDGPEGHHAVNVKRVRSGETIDIVDGQGHRAVCSVAATHKSGLRATVLEVVGEPEPLVTTVLVQALSKGDRDLQAVEAAVELGIDAVVPWQAERCVVRWPDAKAEKGRAKWASTVRSAVKQSRRSRTPVVEPALGTTALARRIAAAPQPPESAGNADTANAGAALQAPLSDGVHRLAIVLHEAATRSLAGIVADGLAARDWPAPAGEAGAGTGQDGPERAPESGAGERRWEITLIVGPEGGISETELAKLVDAGAVAARMGRNVLRASTAGPAALVLVRHLAGLLDADLPPRPPR